MEIFNTPICPECGSKHSIEYMDDSGDSHLHPENDLIQAEMDAEQAREMPNYRAMMILKCWTCSMQTESLMNMNGGKESMGNSEIPA